MSKLSEYFSAQNKLFDEAGRVAEIWLKAKFDSKRLDVFEIQSVDEDEIYIEYGGSCRCYYRTCWKEYYNIPSSLMFKLDEEITDNAKGDSQDG